MRRLIRIFTVCLGKLFFILIIKIWNKQGRCLYLPDVRSYLTLQYFVSFLVVQNRVGCFTFIVFLMSPGCRCVFASSSVIHLQFLAYRSWDSQILISMSPTANLWVQKTIFHNKPAIPLHPGTHWNKNFASQRQKYAQKMQDAQVKKSLLPLVGWFAVCDCGIPYFLKYVYRLLAENSHVMPCLIFNKE